MSTLDERLEILSGELKEAVTEYHAVRARVDELVASSVRLHLLQFAEAFPGITRFDLDATFEYDDEGGYYYSASINAENAEGDFEYPEDQPEGFGNSEDDLYDIAHELSEESSALVFGGESLAGTVTVDELRAAITAQWQS